MLEQFWRRFFKSRGASILGRYFQKAFEISTSSALQARAGLFPIPPLGWSDQALFLRLSDVSSGSFRSSFWRGPGANIRIRNLKALWGFKEAVVMTCMCFALYSTCHSEPKRAAKRRRNVFCNLIDIALKVSNYLRNVGPPADWINSPAKRLSSELGSRWRNANGILK